MTLGGLERRYTPLGNTFASDHELGCQTLQGLALPSSRKRSASYSGYIPFKDNNSAQVSGLKLWQPSAADELGSKCLLGRETPAGDETCKSTCVPDNGLTPVESSSPTFTFSDLETSIEDAELVRDEDPLRQERRMLAEETRRLYLARRQQCEQREQSEFSSTPQSCAGGPVLLGRKTTPADGNESFYSVEEDATELAQRARDAFYAMRQITVDREQYLKTAQTLADHNKPCSAPVLLGRLGKANAQQKSNVEQVREERLALAAENRRSVILRLQQRTERQHLAAGESKSGAGGTMLLGRLKQQPADQALVLTQQP